MATRKISIPSKTKKTGSNLEIIPTNTPKNSTSKNNSPENLKKWYNEMDKILGGDELTVHGLPNGYGLPNGGTRKKSRSKKHRSRSRLRKGK